MPQPCGTCPEEVTWRDPQALPWRAAGRWAQGEVRSPGQGEESPNLKVSLAPSSWMSARCCLSPAAQEMTKELKQKIVVCRTKGRVFSKYSNTFAETKVLFACVHEVVFSGRILHFDHVQRMWESYCLLPFPHQITLCTLHSSYHAEVIYSIRYHLKR